MWDNSVQCNLCYGEQYQGNVTEQLNGCDIRLKWIVSQIILYYSIWVTSTGDGWNLEFSSCQVNAPENGLQFSNLLRGSVDWSPNPLTKRWTLPLSYSQYLKVNCDLDKHQEVMFLEIKYKWKLINLVTPLWVRLSTWNIRDISALLSFAFAHLCFISTISLRHTFRTNMM